MLYLHICCLWRLDISVWTCQHAPMYMFTTVRSILSWLATGLQKLIFIIFYKLDIIDGPLISVWAAGNETILHNHMNTCLWLRYCQFNCLSNWWSATEVQRIRTKSSLIIIRLVNELNRSFAVSAIFYFLGKKLPDSLSAGSGRHLIFQK